MVLFGAVAPAIGFGAARLLGAEVSGLTQTRFTPRLADTAKALLVIYLALTVAGVLALLLAGMDLYDAVVHTFATVAAKGFSSKTALARRHTTRARPILLRDDCRCHAERDQARIGAGRRIRELRGGEGLLTCGGCSRRARCSAAWRSSQP